MKDTVIVAVDGPAGSGKSSVAALLAKRLGVEHVDTGGMYRAFALRCLRSKVNLEDEAKVAVLVPDTHLEVVFGKVLLDGSDITGELRRPEVSAASSVIAQYPSVRDYMVTVQRSAVKAAPAGAIVEGRDIGTVVLPDADVKIYLTASEVTRAARRAAQAGLSVSEGLSEIAQRDSRDSARKHSPLKPASDAIVVDTSDMNLEQVVDKVEQIVAGARS
ncbi:MAG: (d)CMP kinase [Actinomycetota bacterium]